jgi:tetratricopeptide (TPR) repeat protein
LFVLVVGSQVVRTALLGWRGASSNVVESAWPSHPQVLTSSIMADVGKAAAEGDEPGEPTLAELRQLAASEPLAVEPMLIQGAVALRSGDYKRAEALLLEARRRGPRSPGARYLLGDVYLRTGRPLQAMAEMAVLNRLIPAASMQLAPALAQYAMTPGAGASGQVASILAAYPELEQPLLAELAKEPKNADLVLLLAGRSRSRTASPPWQRVLLNSMIKTGEHAKARAIWAKLARVPEAEPGLFNAAFQPINAPPPFNWEITGGSGGVAEAREGGLEILYFGRDDVVFARQTLLLRPGRYRLQMNVTARSGDPAAAAWSVSCLGAKEALIDLPLRSGAVGADFSVPGGCPVQEIRLRAEGKEFPEQADFRIADLRLGKAGAR